MPSSPLDAHLYKWVDVGIDPYKSFFVTAQSRQILGDRKGRPYVLI